MLDPVFFSVLTFTILASASLHKNGVENMIYCGGELLGEEKNLPYHPPLCEKNSVSTTEVRYFDVKERAISFIGNEIDVYDATSGEPFTRVRGAILNFSGKDKMRFRSITAGCGNKEVTVLDKVLLSLLPAFDIYRGGTGGEKIGRIVEKDFTPRNNKFHVYIEGEGGISPNKKSPPAYDITGDAFHHSFVMKNAEGEVVAKIQKKKVMVCLGSSLIIASTIMSAK